MKFRRRYLEKIATVETPKWNPGMYDEDKEEQVKDYCDLRNYAKDLLLDTKKKEAREKLSELVIKLGIQI